MRAGTRDLQNKIYRADNSQQRGGALSKASVGPAWGVSLPYLVCALTQHNVVIHMQFPSWHGASVLEICTLFNMPLWHWLLVAAPLAYRTDQRSHTQVFGLFLGAGSLLHCGR